MRNNKKGLSTIVATLLIILLTLVAVGIIWIVVRGVVQGGTNQVDLSSKCLATEIVATKVTNTSTTAYHVTLNVKSADDKAPVGGVMLVFTDPTESTSYPVPIASTGANALPSLKTVTVDADLTGSGLVNPNKVSVVVYFLDDSGNKQLCTTANALTFA
jgi:hypothetical protein